MSIEVRLACIEELLAACCGCVEVPYLRTVPLVSIGDSIAFEPDLVFKSVSFYVKSGAVEVSFDGGATFTATYDASDPSASFGQGNNCSLDVSALVIRATADNTIVQVIGETE